MRTFRWVIQIAALCAPLLSARAQRPVRGVATDSASAAPVAGAVITILSATGATLARTVSDSRGQFTVTVAGDGVPAHARVLRIGFRPRDLDLAAVTDSPLRVVMVRLPPLLDAVRVTDRELCPNSSDRGGAFALWEQVRAGLLGTIVAREANPALATMLTYERREDAGDHIVEWQTVLVRSGNTTRPFIAAASAKQFADAGFMATDTAGQTLFAPDADVLLDEAFAATHCFRTQRADAGHRGEVGLAFTPARRRSGVVDVAGVVWVDAAVPSLRTLEFRHTGFDPRLDRTPPGGHIEFRTAANGLSFIDRWWIDIPILRVHRGAVGTIVGGRVSASQSDLYTVDEIQYSGGLVLAARWNDGSSWAPDPSGVSGTVVEQGLSRPIAGALVSVDGTADTVTTDSAGRFSLTPLVTGRYRLRVADTTLESFARGRSSSRVADVLEGRVVDLRFELPAIGETIAQACKADHRVVNADDQVFNSVLVGHLVDRDSGYTNNGEVRATWRVNLGGTPLDLSREALVDARGRFILCGVPSSVVFSVTWNGGGARADTSVMLKGREVGRLEWRLPPAPTRSPPPER